MRHIKSKCLNKIINKFPVFRNFFETNAVICIVVAALCFCRAYLQF